MQLFVVAPMNQRFDDLRDFMGQRIDDLALHMNQRIDAQVRRFVAQDERPGRLEEGITNFDRRVSLNVAQIEIICGQTETVDAP